MLQPQALREMVQQALKKFGSIHVLINNAGIQHVAPIEEFPEEKWDAVVGVNLTAASHLIKAVWAGMKDRGWSRIITIASVHGLFASEFKSAYVGAAFSLDGGWSAQ